MTNNSTGALLADSVIQRHKAKMEQRRKEERERHQRQQEQREFMDAAWALWVEGSRVLAAYSSDRATIRKMKHDFALAIYYRLAGKMPSPDVSPGDVLAEMQHRDMLQDPACVAAWHEIRKRHNLQAEQPRYEP